ncbi:MULTISPECIES: D-alanyl-D-alanine carboxypeptidase/D-alanyl-D-alanine-endopeptidase [unclassified Brevibacterium]|uniref:D-alanyl-D-alanine carboxypeptidase/D-alanyl-D-alanine endopeptidase n=1 Tax=unclassified Brevibacterium TaxID=2614124 RepID=UPI0020178514|nr:MULTISPECIES: D-alanyl-D-alanine carboxypeptidase/D-alanyl-D-alanine-endopeptidase [unclassified Brevibacterium]MCM1013626.1 D-alanyl-D-alanine carboxypeptidase/D-alanyl-D-alanine-endopeptidase [Brevibacterium sp. XM4083]
MTPTTPQDSQPEEEPRAGSGSAGADSAGTGSTGASGSGPRGERKRSGKRLAAGITAGVLLAGALGYGVADAADVVPGFLTTEPAIEVDPLPQPVAAGQDVPAPASALTDSAPIPQSAGSELERILGDSQVKGFGVEVRDALTDQVLFATDENRARTPASVTKVLTASAALLAIGGEQRLSTTAAFDPATSTVTLVGGGDVLLGAGESQPGAVNGHAGLKTLAEETAAALKERQVTEVALAVDTSRYPGNDFNPSWERADIAKGVITPIQPLMVDSGYVGDPSAAWRGRSENPSADALAAFRTALETAGITVTDQQAAPGAADTAGTTPDPTDTSAGSEGPATLATVESATISEIVEYALVHSDNVVAEVLGNEVAIAQGMPGSLENGPKAVIAALEDTVDLGQTQLYDTSGLDYGNRISPHDLTTVLQASVVAEDSLSSLISYFPVGGLTGTLTDRFGDDPNAAGAVHAKTGTLSTVTSLAGGVLDADGRYLVFSFQIDGVDRAKILEARKTVDDAVSALADCGCS